MATMARNRPSEWRSSRRLFFRQALPVPWKFRPVSGFCSSAIGNTEIQVDLGTKHAGYIPYDEVSADPTVKAEDILKVGDEIEVCVVRVNDQEGTVQLC